MDDEAWIRELRRRMTAAGWTVFDPESSKGVSWLIGAVRFGREATGTAPIGGGDSALAAVEDLYRQTMGELPHRPGELRDGETFEHELDGVADDDLDEFISIRDDFHRHGYDLIVFHPMSDTWHAQWTPHNRGEPIGEVPPGHGSALETAKRAWEAFQSRPEGSGS